MKCIIIAVNGSISYINFIAGFKKFLKIQSLNKNFSFDLFIKC